MRRFVIWLLAGTASAMLTIIMLLPATWVAAFVEQQTTGRLTLVDAHGTLWNGSAYIGGAASDKDPVTPLLPGRFSWRLSPTVLFGRIDAELENTPTLSQPINVTGSWHQWQVSPAAITLPADRLAALGSPLNTLQPSGQLRLSWNLLQIVWQNGIWEISGLMNLEISGLASRLSPVKPLGTYNLALDWHETQASVTLKTNKGPMLLSGSGTFKNGRMQFSGKAEAETGQEEKLGNFLNLLGQRRTENNKQVIALEFK